MLGLAASVWSDEFVKPDASEQKAGFEFFEKQVRPILVERCYECHSGDESNGGLRVDSKSLLLIGGDLGAALVPGDSKSSLLIRAIGYLDNDLQMPPKSRLPEKEIEILDRWIAMGAPDPRTETQPALEIALTGMSIEDGRKFWSIAPIADSKIPIVVQADWLKTPIDAFILSKLDEHMLVPNRPADKRTLIRRVTYDLIGLPPTPDEIRAFLDDESDDAFDRVVDRLLESPQYGIRWGRHWLDVIRYADSNGLDENLCFGNAWRYRDYVVEAFNRDKPFDRFLIEQIAGDLVPDANLETKIATGFLVLGAKVLAEPDKDKLIMDTIDEQLDTMGKTFWGMTLGCVRCHDHKFDPLKQSDYYALAAIFKSTKTFGDTKNGAIKHWNEHVFASDVELDAIKAIDAKIAVKNKAAADYKRQALQKSREAARSHAAQYLACAAQLSPECSLVDAEAIAKPMKMNSHLLHRVCRYMANHQQEPFFAAWTRLAQSQDWKGIEEIYSSHFERVELAVAEGKKVDPKSKKLDAPDLDEARRYLDDADGFLAIPTKPEFIFDATSLTEYERLSEEARLLESNAPDIPSAMSVVDDQIHHSIPIHIRGSHRNLGEATHRGFPVVMASSGIKPILPRNESGRLELAQWMASPTHPLTARVYVNRLWQWHFGTGLVGTPDNFGSTGNRPSHPELLDWLARYFVEAKWSTKAMHRLITSSSTYQMASESAEDELALNSDPENRLLSRFPRQRLDVEQIRDSLLAIANKLDGLMGGKSIGLRNRQFVFNHTSTDHSSYDLQRRSIYIPVIRNHLYNLFEQFDFPDPTMPTGNRSQTTIPSQALAMMNSDLVMDCSNDLAKRLMNASSDPASRVSLAFELVYGRPADEPDIRLATEFVTAILATRDDATLRASAGEEQQAWSLYCQSLFASNEFVFVR